VDFLYIWGAGLRSVIESKAKNVAVESVPRVESAMRYISLVSVTSNSTNFWSRPLQVKLKILAVLLSALPVRQPLFGPPPHYSCVLSISIELGLACPVS
jgi:hypothetical protein